MFNSKKKKDVLPAEEKVRKLKTSKEKPEKVKKVVDPRYQQLSNLVDEYLREAGIDPNSREGKKKHKLVLDTRIRLRDEDISKIAPSGNLNFQSDYFLIDGYYATILTFVAPKGRIASLQPMWGLQMTPVVYDRTLRNDVTTYSWTSIARWNSQWAEDKLSVATDVNLSGVEETTKSNQGLDAMLFRERARDTEIIASEISNGASYLSLSLKVIVKASSREKLDLAVSLIRRDYASRISSSEGKLTKFVGEQQTDYSRLMDVSQQHIGNNFSATSTELAGMYPFMMRGLSDPHGAYVGMLSQDVNSGAVIWDTLNFDNLMMIGVEGASRDVNGEHAWRATTGWGAQIAQDALIAGHRVQHIVLNQENVLAAGRDLTDISLRIPMSQGVLNPFEAFGRTDEEISAFNVLVEKIKLMASEMSHSLVSQNVNDVSVLSPLDLQVLSDQLHQFYIGEELWQEDATSHRDRLRLVNIPHAQVPRLRAFLVYLRTAKKTAETAAAKNMGGQSDAESLRRLYLLFRQIYSIYGDLFDKITVINDQLVSTSRQTIFDLGDLNVRSKAALAAQFVNTLAYSEKTLRREDVLIIHGAEELKGDVELFLQQRMQALNNNAVKVVLMYNDINEMVKHEDFFGRADVMLTGKMTSKALKAYQKQMTFQLPAVVSNAMTSNDPTQYFLRRGSNDSIVFVWDSIL